MLPDTSWLLFRQEFLNYQVEQMWALLLPPYPSTDSYNRATFIPMSIPITSPPAGTHSADVLFGYQEYGAPSSMNCTTRAEQCVTVSSSVPSGTQPFSYGTTDTWTPMACGSGCTLVIPAISQRVLYYTIQYRGTGGTVIAESSGAGTVP